VLKLLPTVRRQVGVANLVKQLEKCAPAGGANYEEARGAESPADFVHKIRIALKEVRETRYWLRLLARAELTTHHHDLQCFIDEADQLIALLTASAQTARRRGEHA